MPKETIFLKQYGSPSTAIRMSDLVGHTTMRNALTNAESRRRLRRNPIRHSGESPPTSTGFYRDSRFGCEEQFARRSGTRAAFSSPHLLRTRRPNFLAGYDLYEEGRCGRSSKRHPACGGQGRTRAGRGLCTPQGHAVGRCRALVRIYPQLSPIQYDEAAE